MATSLFLLLDDIAAVLDDVATMTKVAATKTAGVLGDDLALNAQQVAGVRPDRELPVVWAVARGSLRNKAILVPAALAIASFAPWLIAPLLMLGGAFLCFEGAEKLAQRWLHGDADPDAERQARRSALADPAVDLAAFERDKVRGAVRTDFILSAEIITIALGVVDGEPLGVQAAVLAGVALAMTVGVYGLVGGIVKLDDAGLWLSRRPGAVAQRAGRGLLAAAPRLMQALSVLGTLAMFLVGGGILVHGLSPLHHALAGWLDGLPGTARLLAENLANGLAGLLAGALVLAVVTGLQTLRGASHRRRG